MEKKKGIDGKACWQGYRYSGTENSKDKCVKIGERVIYQRTAFINSRLGMIIDGTGESYDKILSKKKIFEAWDMMLI